MNTDQTAVVTVNAKSADVRTFEFEDADSDAAISLGVVLAGDVDDRLARAAVTYNTANRLAVETGYLLLSVKSDMAHGAFVDRIEQMGLSRFRAAELMRIAKFTTAMPSARRAELMHLPKTKMILLAGADQEVIADVLESEDTDLNALSVRELRAKLKELQAENTDAQVKLTKTEAELDIARKRNEKGARADNVPTVVADLRDDINAEVKKADLAADALQEALGEMNGLRGGAAHGWVDPSLQLALAGIAGVVLRYSGLLRSLEESLGAEVLKADLPAGAYLSPDEVRECSLRYSELIRADQHERELRDWNRKQARPAGRGRPAAKPTLSGAAQ